MTFDEDRCLVCRDYIDFHGWCETAERFTCSPCECDDERCRP